VQKALRELGISSDYASEHAIKQAYRKQAIKWHPDKNAGNDARSRYDWKRTKAGLLWQAFPRVPQSSLLSEETVSMRSKLTTSTACDVPNSVMSKPAEAQSAIQLLIPGITSNSACSERSHAR
jgi:hypothetical protein